MSGQLDRAAHRKLTIVAGPPGSGKTAMIGAWAAEPHRDLRVAWLTLDQFDDDPRELWGYLTASLRGGDDAQLMDSPAALTGWLSHLDQPIVLVVDNAESMDGVEAQSVITSLLRTELPQLHLVLVSRRRLQLGTGRIRLAEQLTEIGVDDLAFTPAEAVAMWAAHGMWLGEQDAKELIERTDGLAAAVQLQARAAQERAPTTVLEAGEDELAAFIRSEIFLALPEDVREFLLRISVLPTVSAEVATVLTLRGDAGGVLQRLHDDGLASWADHDRSMMRVREPLRGFLRTEASVAIGQELRRLHLKAARWFARHGDPLTAARHCAFAGDWAYGSRLVVQLAAPSIAGRDAARLREVLVEMPVTQVRHQPESAAALALLRADQDAPEGAEGYAEIARRQLARLPAERELPLRAVLDLVAVIVGGEREDFAGVETAASGLIALLKGPTEPAIPTAAKLTAIAMAGLGTARLWAGRVNEAETALLAAIKSSAHDHLEFVTADAHGKLALLEALRGNLREAADRAGTALNLLSEAGSAHPSDAVPSRIALGIVHWLRGQTPQAMDCLDQAAADSLHAPRRTNTIALAAARARVLISGRNIAAARAVLADAQAVGESNGSTPLLDSWLATSKAALYLQEGRPINALTVLNAAVDECAPPIGGGAQILAARAYLGSAAPARAVRLVDVVQRRELPPWADIEVWLVKALAADQLGHHGTARITLAEAVASTARAGLVQPLLDADPALKQLLDANRDLLELHESLAAHLHGRSAKDHPPAGSITERETAVLRYLPTLLTRNEIATELSVSSNTVKAHMRSLFQKLCVGSRRAAVDRARALGLLK